MTPAAPTELAGSSVALDAMPPGRRAVLSTLKSRGEASASDVAAVLGVTVGAVRQLLAPLEDEGLVAHRDERPGPGRPRRRYCLTPAAESLWPKRYGELTNQLLSFIRADAVDAAFEQRRQVRVSRALARMAGQTFDERVVTLAAILDEDGYLASCAQTEDGWEIVEHNCAILDVAQHYGTACGTELAFLQEVMADAEVRRTAHMMAGAHVCAYAITPSGTGARRAS